MTSGLTALFDLLRQHKVNFVSIKDGIDLATPAGRLMANVLASVAQFETELRGERVAAGQAVAKAKGKTWGGSKPGVAKKLKPPTIKAIKQMKANGENVTTIARTFGISRQTVYNLFNASTN
jgi:DNA invertase Pin-like site-specific DNA recombinase